VQDRPNQHWDTASHKGYLKKGSTVGFCTLELELLVKKGKPLAKLDLSLSKLKQSEVKLAK